MGLGRAVSSDGKVCKEGGKRVHDEIMVMGGVDV